MKKILFIILLITSLSSDIYGESGPPIPKPKISIERTIVLARAILHTNSSTRTIDSEKNSELISKINSEYIIISITFTNTYEDINFEEWAWVVTFIHPVQNDSSFTYKIVDDSNVKLISATR